MQKLKKVGYLALICFAILLFFLCLPLKAPFNSLDSETSLEILDRQGRVLRELYSLNDGVSNWVNLEDMPDYLVRSVLIAEDRRFYYHIGFDLLAIARSGWNNWHYGRVVMGGSTITQQLVRSLSPPKKRSYFNKIVETWQAVRLECHYSKAKILEAYLNRVYFGCQSYGVQAAAKRYFDKSVYAISPAESSFLAVLPRAPDNLDLLYDTSEVTKLQKIILGELYKEGTIDEKSYKLALEIPIEIAPLSQRFAAPHFCDFVMQNWNFSFLPNNSQLRTTLDGDLEKEVESLLLKHLNSLKKKKVGNGAVVVLDNKTGEILALAGSKDYFAQPDGQVNGCLSLRQPGSALKPFTYQMALERGYTASSLLPDIEYQIPTGKSSYTPKNYDWTTHGPVRLREALACSYNVAAVRLLEDIGTGKLLNRLHDLGIASLDKTPKHYGFGLTLGDGEVTLLELANAYRAFANSGIYSPCHFLLDENLDPDELNEFKNLDKQKAESLENTDTKDKLNANNENKAKRSFQPLAPLEQTRVMSPCSSFIITDILADPYARSASFGRDSSLALPFPCASKTGTSKSYRDNWTCGYTPKYTVAVWVGNFDASSMVDVSGITGAAPLFAAVMRYLYERDNMGDKAYLKKRMSFEKPRDIVKVKICPASGDLLGPNCSKIMEEYYTKNNTPKNVCSVHKICYFDKRTGLEADGTTDKQFVISKICEIYQPLYYHWMSKAGMFVPRTSPKGDNYGKLPKSYGDSRKLRIFSPEDGAVYRLDPILRPKYQKIIFKAGVPAGVSQVEWFVDGKKIAAAFSPFSTFWTLQKGVHTVTLKISGFSDNLSSKDVDNKEIDVEITVL